MNNQDDDNNENTKASINQGAFSNTAFINTASIRGSTMSDQNQNQYQQYGYDNFDNAEQPQANSGFYSGFRARFASPGIATFLLLTLSVGVVWYAVVAEPKQPDVGDLPIISADASSYKTKPENAGGMEIVNKDSTVFGTARGEGLNEIDPVENLLAEKAADKLQEFAKEAGRIMDKKPMPENLLASVSESDVSAPSAILSTSESNSGQESAMEGKASDLVTPKPVKKPEQMARPVRPDSLHAPGSSPDTLAFVRAALEKKSDANVQDEPPASAAAAALAVKSAAVEPAAGFASGDRKFYVQLSSITDQARSGAEWSKLQEKYPTMLESAPHRVQKADLGDRGMYYRIQAGPFEKDGAVSVCEQIKSVNPNGCLVVK